MLREMIIREEIVPHMSHSVSGQKSVEKKNYINQQFNGAP